MPHYTFRAFAMTCVLLSLAGCAAVEPRATVDGQAVADRLNTRYAATVDDCAGQPAYLCSGVALRVADPFGVNQPPFDPTPTQIARNGASFSFVRRDLGIKTLFQLGWAGYVVDLQEQPGLVSLKPRCGFPFNAFTNTRPDGCGYSRMDMTPTLKSRPCAAQNIHTPEAWGAHFAALPDADYFCGFDASTQGFLLSMQSRASIPQDHPLHDKWNELLIGIWKKEDVQRLPVEAVFYTPTDVFPHSHAQRYQCRVFFAMGRPVPMLKMDLSATGNQVFTFNEADQIDFEHATPSCDYGKSSARGR